MICNICGDATTLENPIISLKCGHSTCQKCKDVWANTCFETPHKDATCPECRKMYDMNPEDKNEIFRLLDEISASFDRIFALSKAEAPHSEGGKPDTSDNPDGTGPHNT